MAARLMSQERRRAPRTAERIAVSISDAASAFQAETKNLSASGAYCVIDRFIPPMTKLQLQFDLPDGTRHTSVRCSGVVVRVDPVVANAERGRYHIAIFFNDLAEKDRAAIGRFVGQRLAASRPGQPS